MNSGNWIGFTLGVISWPALEYFLHRFLGHEWSFQNLFRREHQTHHRVKDFFAPAYLKGLMSVAVLGGIYLLGKLFGIRSEIGFYVGGILATYLFYEWTHYSFHRLAPRTRMGLLLRKHHFFHHFKNAKCNYGVTTAFFDFVFGTFIRPETTTVPAAFAMNWLLNPEGQVKPEYREHFMLIGGNSGS